jgi:dihydrofolate reductase
MDADDVAFSEVMDPMRKVVASGTLDAVDWNAELISGDVVEAVWALKEQPGRGIALGGVQLPATLAARGLIDEYTFVIPPVVAGRGPRLLDGIRDQLRLELVERREFRSGATAQRHKAVS